MGWSTPRSLLLSLVLLLALVCLGCVARDGDPGRDVAFSSEALGARFVGDGGQLVVDVVRSGRSMARLTLRRGEVEAEVLCSLAGAVHEGRPHTSALHCAGATAEAPQEQLALRLLRVTGGSQATSVISNVRYGGSGGPLASALEVLIGPLEPWAADPSQLDAALEGMVFDLAVVHRGGLDGDPFTMLDATAGSLAALVGMHPYDQRGHAASALRLTGVAFEVTGDVELALSAQLQHGDERWIAGVEPVALLHAPDSESPQLADPASVQVRVTQALLRSDDVVPLAQAFERAITPSTGPVNGLARPLARAALSPDMAEAIDQASAMIAGDATELHGIYAVYGSAHAVQPFGYAAWGGKSSAPAFGNAVVGIDRWGRQAHVQGPP
jgi:hypothetical protein